MPDRSDRRSGEDPTPAPVSEGAPKASVGVRGCRGHFHVFMLNDDGSEGDDLGIQGDPFATREAAETAAATLNRGEELPAADWLSRRFVPTPCEECGEIKCRCEGSPRWKDERIASLEAQLAQQTAPAGSVKLLTRHVDDLERTYVRGCCEACDRGRDVAKLLRLLAARLPALEAENRTLREQLAAYRSHTCDTYGARGQCSRCAPLSIENTVNG